MSVRSYRDLLVWQKGIDFVECVYKASACFPPEERYGLTSQLRRSAVSVPSNIAEGQGRQTTRDFLHRLFIANGSLYEAETQVILAHKPGLLKEADQELLLNQSAEVGRLLHGLANALEKKQTTEH